MSQFASLFKTDAGEKAEAKTETKPKTKSEKKKPETASLSPAPKTVESATPKDAATKRAGGKSSNPDYTQVLTYIRRDTHKAIKKALLDDDQNRDLSDLVEELLAGWVKNNRR